MIGCAESHLGILEQGTLAFGPFFVFEDDVELLTTFNEVRQFIDSIEHEWDILLLGANEYVGSEQFTATYSKVNRFWGTHAMLIHPKCCAGIMSIFADATKDGIFLPADWMYNEAIRLSDIRVYGPTNPKRFFRQKEGLQSLITGNVR